MQLSYIGRRVNTLFLHAPIAFVGAVGVLLLLVAGVMWVPGLAEAQEDAEYVWAFEDFGRIVVHWDHEGLSALHSGGGDCQLHGAVAATGDTHMEHGCPKPRGP